MERKKYTAEEIEKKFASLPEEIKAFLYSVEMLENIKKIGEKHKLHIDQVGILEAETSEVMLGFTNTKDFPAILEESLEIENQKAQLIAQDINDQLFVKIRDAMKRTDNQQKGEDEKQKIQFASPPAASAPLAAPQIKVTPSAPEVKLVPPSPPPTPVVLPPQVPLTSKLPVITPTDMALSQKTVSIPKPAAPTSPTNAPQTTSIQSSPSKPETLGRSPASDGALKPPPYKADPYREPPE